ncbi:uncharacterized protein METZ01_LOCUS234662 [marine metagenome]|uniref:Uncharacterized protein n=1 Tax=marine metagenome TaxID=408172 RepID=A0A382H3D9_9ZZZZ
MKSRLNDAFKSHIKNTYLIARPYIIILILQFGV